MVEEVVEIEAHVVLPAVDLLLSCQVLVRLLVRGEDRHLVPEVGLLLHGADDLAIDHHQQADHILDHILDHLPETVHQHVQQDQMRDLR